MSLVEQELLTLSDHLRSPPVLSGVRVIRSLVLFVCFVDRCLSFFTFAFGHCVVCPSIYGFCLPLWYFQTLLTLERIYIELPVLSVHLDCPFRVPSAMCPRFFFSGQIDVSYAYKSLAMRNVRDVLK